MPFNLQNRDLLSLVHHSERDLIYLLDLARDLSAPGIPAPSGTAWPERTSR